MHPWGMMSELKRLVAMRHGIIENIAHITGSYSSFDGQVCNFDGFIEPTPTVVSVDN